MSYQNVDRLTFDVTFNGRVRACTVEQGAIFREDERADIAATGVACMMGDATITNAFTRLIAAFPGMGDRVDDGQGGIDQSRVLDADILAQTQANWPTVASLYFNEDGSSKL